MAEAEYFCRKVHDLRMGLRAVVFNRTHREFINRHNSISTEQLAVLLDRLLGDKAAAAKMSENFSRYEMLGRGDCLRMEAFSRRLPKGAVIVEVPNFTTDIHSLAGLRAMHRFLF